MSLFAIITTVLLIGCSGGLGVLLVYSAAWWLLWPLGALCGAWRGVVGHGRREARGG